jgi:hypothetical protein
MNATLRKNASQSAMVIVVVAMPFLLAMARENEKITDEEYHSHRFLTLMDDQEPLASLFPLGPSDYIGFACAILGLVLAAGGGVSVYRNGCLG